MVKKLLGRCRNSTDLWRIHGSFGNFSSPLSQDRNTYISRNSICELVSDCEETEYGVLVRKDHIRNVSQEKIELNTVNARFVLDGGEYEVFTLYSHWQTENTGGWQPLVTEVTLRGQSVRTCTSAVPFLVLWNKQTQHGTVFHIFPRSAWAMRVRREAIQAGNKFAQVVVEFGIQEENFHYSIQPGDILELPEILCYETTSQIHMDSYKLHHYMNIHYPRKQFPMIFNTWMYRFHHINYDVLERQIIPAAEMGLEYFVIDAGWFGKGGFWQEIVGDWEENMTSALCGQMIDIANKVRQNGMKFGLWLEPERAMPDANVLKTHGEYYIQEGGCYFLDFSRKDVYEWMLDKISALIERYGIEFIKFDFNEDMYWDKDRSSFVKYHAGFREFIENLRKRFPNLYLSGCAAGGARLNLENCRLFDSFWPTDHEGPKEELEMYKNLVRRCTPNVFEKWAVVRSICEFEPVYTGGKSELLYACNGATWTDIEGVKDSFMLGHLTGSPIGFSCDLLELSETKRAMFAEHIRKIKKKRDFWKDSVCRVLVDTPTVTAFEYSNMNLDEIVIQVFPGNVLQDHITVYPEIDPNKVYRMSDGAVRSGTELLKYGLSIEISDWNEMIEVCMLAIS